MVAMTNPDETAARTTLRIAGVFQEIRDSWVRRLDSYFNQIESLTEGDWIELQDLIGIIKESRMAAREAIDGMGNDLSSELVHTSHGIITRYEAERESLQEEINDLRKSLARALSGEANSIRRENQALREAIGSIPEFRLLEIIQEHKRLSYDDLAEISHLSKAKIRKLVKVLFARGYIHIDKRSRPHTIVHISTPWMPDAPDSRSSTDVSPSVELFQTKLIQ